MSCPNSAEIYFDFQNDEDETYLKIRPKTMQFDRTRGSFDYCQAEFSDQVAKHIKPYLEDDDSFLRQPLPVFVIINGDAVYRLLWVPDGVRFTDDSVHIEFHDPQKYLTRGVVDWRRDSVKLRDAYNHVFSKRDTDGPDIFNGIEYTVPENAYEKLDAWKSGLIEWDRGDLETEARLKDAKGDSEFKARDGIDDLEEENVYNIIDGHYAVDFDKISPWECITELNEKFGVTTWAEPDGNFYVGARGPTGRKNVATPDDKRVWKISDYNVVTPRDPVVKCVVRGGWVSNPTEHYEDTIGQLFDLNRGTDDFRLEAVASNGGDVTFGQEIFFDLVEAKKDSLESIAKRKMINKQREQQSGYIEILPEISGDSFSEIQHVSIGDELMTIPPDNDRDENSMCDTNISVEKFDVTGVQHGLTGDGEWTLRLDVTKRLDDKLNPENIETNLRYYDPHNKETIEGDQYTYLAETDRPFYPKLTRTGTNKVEDT